MMDIYLKITHSAKLREMMHNKIATTIAFIMLMASIFFIQLHPYSVWYYFFSGFFIGKMLQLILEKSEIKLRITRALSDLKKLSS